MNSNSNDTNKKKLNNQNRKKDSGLDKNPDNFEESLDDDDPYNYY